LYDQDTRLHSGRMDNGFAFLDEAAAHAPDSAAQAGAVPASTAAPGLPWQDMLDAASSPASPQAPPPSTTASPAAGQPVPSAQALDAARSTSVQVGSGSGVIVGRQGDDYYVLTNAHVVGFFNDKEKLVMPDGAELDGEVVQSNHAIPMGDESDLAVVKVKAAGKDYSVANWGAEEPAPGTAATQAGFPKNDPTDSGTLHSHGRGLQYIGAEVTEDLQSASGAGQRVPGSYEVGLSGGLTVGSSGGGTFDNDGRLIGINGFGVVNQGPTPAQDGGSVELADGDTKALLIDVRTAREHMHGVVPGF
jgi:S1-C subfamily serine protease